MKAEGILSRSILEWLQSGDGFVSGNTLCEQLNVSRTTVWKHIEQLRKAGYGIEASTNKGYRLVHRPDALFPAEITGYLQGQRFGHAFTYKDSVTSTNDEALLFARSGAEEGHVVVANEQTRGRGRRGHSWFSPPGTGIWMSVIARPRIALAQASSLTLFVAVAVARAVKEITGLQSGIKWPNDIVISGRKVCGILVEVSALAEQVQHAIIGIGLNVNVPADQFPLDLRAKAGSLQSETGRTYRRSWVLAVLLKHLQKVYDLFISEGGFAAIRDEWVQYNITLGQRVSVRTDGTTWTGQAIAIDESGVLEMIDDRGVRRRVHSGDLELLMPPQTAARQ